MLTKVYEFQAVIHPVPDKGGAYIILPYDIRQEFGKGIVKVHATFDGHPYDGSIVNMGMKDEVDNISYIFCIQKTISAAIGR
ncbi:DUF1905 domain-containing protein [Streptococcus parasuis]|uniref:DUF1905 domain-containing protein n=1 Tax=Streptococcus parasuis TaxID=1501662 RepID=UPI0037D9AB2B